MKFVILIISVFIIHGANAEHSLKLEYSSFYSHLKKLDKEELSNLEFAFGFANVHTKLLCDIHKATIVTDKKNIDVSVDAENRFTLPTEKALKLAHAQVHLELEQAPNQCDLSVLLQVKPALFESGVNLEKLKSYDESFIAFFDKMGGLFSFMMPKPKGIRLVTDEIADVPESMRQYLTSEREMLLEHDVIGRLPSDVLSQVKVSRITAFMQN